MVTASLSAWGVGCLSDERQRAAIRRMREGETETRIESVMVLEHRDARVLKPLLLALFTDEASPEQVDVRHVQWPRPSPDGTRLAWSARVPEPGRYGTEDEDGKGMHFMPRGFVHVELIDPATGEPKAWEDGAWVREAAEAYAAKHADQPRRVA